MPSLKSTKEIDEYANSMAKQINHLNNIYPAAQILFIGPSDMSTMQDGHLKTHPYLKETVQSIKEMVLENGAAFWDMFEVMGGENSMIEWADNNPAWAASDYTHFTEKGAAKIAEMFCESLMIYYNYNQFTNNY